MRIESLGHAVFAATLIVLGILGLVSGDFGPIWAPVPKGVPAREALAVLCALVFLVSGIGLLWRRAAAVASRALLGYLLVWLLLFRVPFIVLDPSTGTTWAAGQVAVMAAAAWLLHARFAGGRDGQRAGFVAGEKGLRVARALYGLALIPFGVAHFTFFRRTVSMVPAWLPWHAGWACLTGVAFLAAALAILADVGARLAAMLSALEMGIFTLLVWIPVVAAGPNKGQWHEFVVSCAMTAGGWVVAESYRGTPWLAVGKRSDGPAPGFR